MSMLRDVLRWSLFLATCSFSALVAQTAPAANPLEELQAADAPALHRAIADLVATFGDRYSHGKQYLDRVTALEAEAAKLQATLEKNGRRNVKAAKHATALAAQVESLRQEALLANPLLDFDKLLLVRRGEGRMGLPQNWQGNCSLPARGYDNQIAVLSPVRPHGKVTTLYQPEYTSFVGDLELNPDAAKLLFSMPNKTGRWQVYEMGVDGHGVRQVSTDDPPDVDNYDPCYLPDGRIVFCSSRCFHGVPCVGGGDRVSNLFIMNADGSHVRQLTFDQDHDWCPTVLGNGRVLYTRWEYSDTPHYFTRILFSMNPDGTNQAAYYGSNSYWPNSLFYARPIPGHPTKVVAIVSGHHGVPRMGELVVLDPARGRFEADGAVQRIPGYGQKVEPTIRDQLVNNSWPKFLHPYPLGEKYFLVSCKPSPSEPWGIYLVDTFDNFVLLCEQPGYAMLEPVPLRKTAAPPLIPDRVNLASDQAVVHIADVYSGEAMRGVPRGTVKKLRVYEPYFAYPGMGGHKCVGIDGPWDGRRIWGTVPVERDGSVNFKAPANTPLALQPLDNDGKAVAVMRSWFTAMPGEVVSCVGCHESQNQAPQYKAKLAVLHKPTEIDSWYGPTRGFSFKREVQPVLDKYCVGCHNGAAAAPPDLRLAGIPNYNGFTSSYQALHPFVRRPGPESDYHVQFPMEWHASTSELVQMLEKGHHNVKLDRESWDRLITWIDLNVPDRGTWHEYAGQRHEYERRLAMRTCYANRPENPEEVLSTFFQGTEMKGQAIAFVTPAAKTPRNAKPAAVAGWPFGASEATSRQKALNLPVSINVELAPHVAIDLVLVPPGELVMGTAGGADDELPPTALRIAHPFYMSRTEVTNAQFAAFNARHDSGVISMTAKDQNERGWRVNEPQQPVVRVTWREAMDFCRWVATHTGRRANLPTEAQWEWAARAGTQSPMYFGDVDSDFGHFANLADASLMHMARADSPQWQPRIAGVNDGAMVTTNVGRYQPNAWGLRDMIGNAAEWTRSAYRPYPYNAADGRDDPAAAGTKVVRGGSWYDRPYRATASYRMHYQPWQHVYNVGFRIIVEIDDQVAKK
jgi:formylglycine-generating enzyme required for sulfatase activity